MVIVGMGKAGAEVGAEEERMVALDCEMCITEAGYEVTRITLVDELGKVPPRQPRAACWPRGRA